MSKSLKNIKNYMSRDAKYSVTGNGVVHVRSSDLLKTEKAQKAVKSLKSIQVGRKQVA